MASATLCLRRNRLPAALAGIVCTALLLPLLLLQPPPQPPPPQPKAYQILRKAHVIMKIFNSSAAPAPARVPSCRGLLAGNPADVRLAEARSTAPPDDFLTDGQLAELPCDRLTAAYWTGPVSDLELGFPIAFTVMAHRSFYQVNKLMQAIHRPHNAYCLHVDSKSDAKFVAAARRLSGCLDNVALVESRVVWGEASVLLADLKCFRALLDGKRKWNYVINLTGQEFPIRTLNEMVHILRLMNGSNNMEKLVPSNYKPYPTMPAETGLAGLRWYKGSAHAIISRAAVRYMLEDRRAQQILQHIQRHYAKGRTVPDETFYATLNHNYELLGFPGSYTGSLVTTATEYRQIYRYKIWSNRCRAGLSVHGICIIGAADLKHFNSRPELVANKMYFDFQSDAFRCVQERFWNNTRADYDSRLSKSFVVPWSFYTELEFVKHHA